MRKPYAIVLSVATVIVLAGAGCEKKSDPLSAQPQAVLPYAENEKETASEEAKPLAGTQEAQTPAEITTKELSVKNNMHLITLSTNYGDIQFSTYDADAPKTVKNFTTLAEKGFYDNLTFHRVIKGFMIQGGDPSGNGTGGPGYAFEDELNPATESYKNGYKRGVVAMANAGPNTNGSQFFIMHQDNPLPNQYSIFGKVVQGQEVVDAIANSPTDARERPIKAVVIKSVKVEEAK